MLKCSQYATARIGSRLPPSTHAQFGITTGAGAARAKFAGTVHTRTVLSCPQDTMKPPSGDTAQLVDGIGISNVIFKVPVCMSQIRTVLSYEQDTMKPLSGDTAQRVTLQEALLKGY